jgi:hypothetical protein
MMEWRFEFLPGTVWGVVSLGLRGSLGGTALGRRPMGVIDPGVLRTPRRWRMGVTGAEQVTSLSSEEEESGAEPSERSPMTAGRGRTIVL